MTSPPSPTTVRVSVAVTPEVLQSFQRLAKAGSTSVSRAMGEWLGDTVEAAQFMAEKMEQARAAPKIVMREMHAYALGLADETGDMIKRVQAKGRAEREGGQAHAPHARSALPPPSGNTGGKGPRTGTGKPGGTGARRSSK